MVYDDWQRDGADTPDLDAQVEQVLEPISQAIALVRAAILARRQAHFQPSTACVISSIRSLLAATECLSRDSLILKEYPALAKIRKSILANLAELVALARSASSAYVEGDDANDDEMKEMEMEGMLKPGHDTLENVRAFLTTLAVHGIPLPERKDGEFPSIDGRHRPTESSSTTTSRHTYGSSADSSRSRAQVETLLPRRARKSSSQSDQSQDARLGLQSTRALAEQRGSSGGQDTGRGLAPKVKISRPPNSDGQGSPSRLYNDRTTSPTEIGDGARASSVRLDVLEVIAVIQDQLLSAVAALIGHTHTHSTSSHPSVQAYLIDITRETIDRIRDLLVVVEAVEQHRHIRAIWPRESAQLIQSKVDMYEATGKLIETAKKAASAALHTVTDGEDDGKVNLLQSATAIHRQAAVCIRLVQHCATKKGHPSRSFQIELHPAAGLVSGSASDSSRSSQSHLLRAQPVGQRGLHTLSSLGRQVIDLSSLQERIVRDGSGSDQSESGTSESCDEDEPLPLKSAVQAADEDQTVQVSTLVASLRVSHDASPHEPSFMSCVLSRPRYPRMMPAGRATHTSSRRRFHRSKLHQPVLATAVELPVSPRPLQHHAFFNIVRSLDLRI